MLPGMAPSPHETTGPPWHLLCPQSTLAVSAESLCPHQRGQDASTPKHPWVSSCPRPNQSQKTQQRQSTGCWAVCSRSSSDMERRQQDRWLLPEFRTHASSGLASGTSSPVTLHHNPSTWLGEVKPVKKPNWWSGTHSVTHRQLTLPQHKEDNKDDSSFWVTTASKLWAGCPALVSLSLFLFTKQRSWSGEQRLWDVLTHHHQAEPNTGGREDKSSGLQILLRLNCYEQHRDESLSYLW